MSRSLSELAHAAEQRARAFRLVLRHHPDATPEVLWDDGPEVPCIQGAAALALATGVDIGTRKGLHVLLPYFNLRDGLTNPSDPESGPFEVRVYVTKDHWRVIYWYTAMQHLSPEGKAALLDAARKA